jgi:GTP-binding protein
MGGGDPGGRVFGRPWRFVKSVAGLEGLPPAGRPEFAFAGRSNAGKSTLLNALVERRGLARASNVPGRTQEINYFEPDDLSLYLVDLPGYGFAQAPRAKVAAWTNLVMAYLAGRATLARAYVLVDARHGLMAADRDALRLLDQAAVGYCVVLTKGDKAAPTALEAMRTRTEAALLKHPAASPFVLATSAVTGLGIAELQAEIAARVAA